MCVKASLAPARVPSCSRLVRRTGSVGGGRIRIYTYMHRGIPAEALGSRIDRTQIDTSAISAISAIWAAQVRIWAVLCVLS